MAYKIESITMRLDDRHAADGSVDKVLVAVATFTYANEKFSANADIKTMLKITFDGSKYVSSNKVDPSTITKEAIDEAVEEAVKKEIENINQNKITSADIDKIRNSNYPYPMTQMR